MLVTWLVVISLNGIIHTGCDTVSCIKRLVTVSVSPWNRAASSGSAPVKRNGNTAICFLSGMGGWVTFHHVRPAAAITVSTMPAINKILAGPIERLATTLCHDPDDGTSS